jgi:hypothetical protein
VVFVLQLTPSVLTAYRSDDTTGVSRGTWIVIFGELLRWGAYLYRQGGARP